jgi:hypothetical protein
MLWKKKIPGWNRIKAGEIVKNIVSDDFSSDFTKAILATLFLMG